MSNQVEQIRTRVKIEQKLTEGLFEKGDNSYFDGQNDAYDTILRFIDSLPAKENPILVPESKETPIEVHGKKVVVRYAEVPWIRCSDCALFLGGKCTRPGGECARKAPLSEEIHSLQEWAKIMAEHPELRAEFDKMCPPQPIQGSIAPEADVNKWAVTNAFLHCDRAGKIVSEMYGDKFNNSRNRDKYLAFLGQVNLDDRFGELAEILQRYGAMPAPKEQPEADLEAEIDSYWKKVTGYQPPFAVLKLKMKDVAKIARHFAEWGAEHLKK